MFNIAAEHITNIESREEATRITEREHTERVRMIGALQRTIADAERRRGASMCAAVVAESNRIIFDAKAKLAELAGI